MNEINHNENSVPEHELKITPDVRFSLLSASKWAKFLSIVGFASTGLLVVLSIGFIVAGHAIDEVLYDNAYSMQTMYTSRMPGMMFGVTYIIMAVLYFFPCLFLFRFAGRTKDAMLSGTQASLSTGMRNLKYLYQYTGILTIVGLVFFVFAIIILIIALSFLPMTL